MLVSWRSKVLYDFSDLAWLFGRCLVVHHRTPQTCLSSVLLFVPSPIQARIVWISAGDERVGFETSKTEDADLMYQAICILVDRCHA